MSRESIRSRIGQLASLIEANRFFLEGLTEEDFEEVPTLAELRAQTEVAEEGLRDFRALLATI